MTLRIDLAWLLMVAEHNTPGDPQVTDWGALVAAVSRHRAEIFGRPVYADEYLRAAALMQLLLHVPGPGAVQRPVRLRGRLRLPRGRGV